jgi:uncharacterized protein YndB with AHSA1/START domain
MMGVMGVTVCPTTVVEAPAESVWRLLTLPENYERWSGARAVAQPSGPVAEGQRIQLERRRMGRRWTVHFEVGRVDPPRSLELNVRLPLGVVNHEHVVLSPAGEGRTRVTFN